MADENNFLGKGWSFPPTFDDKTSSIFMVADEEDIAQSLHILLSTRPGERAMHPQYGCNLDVMLFEPVTTSLIAFVQDLIQTAVLYFEARIELDAVNIDTSQLYDGLILIELDYTILASNSRYNLVYPYYISEGSAT